jgi:hypothetical protein
MVMKTVVALLARMLALSDKDVDILPLFSIKILDLLHNLILFFLFLS